MQSSVPPMVVLVHGAWHGAWCWAALQTELDGRGIPSIAVDLPGHGASLEPLADLHTDAAAVTGVVQRIDRPVVLVGHSYGGAVIGSVTASNVIHQVYVAAYVLDTGESVMGLTRTMAEQLPADPHTGPSALAKAIVPGDGVMTINGDLAHDAFYGRCDPVATPANVARLSPQPTATMSQPAAAASWRDVPSTYIRCLDDRAVSVPHQDFMAARCTHVETLDTDHSPFSSMTPETAEIIARIARG